ncbi:rhodanese-like domain-containing protein [Clostridium sp. Marseille-Q2269]|uniref:sulfurtransferase n=1 Tax=Clostridium sp. Marseille-Q2269 TaxID=2942205 RepID=UPI0020746052|nr:rhodanese-like domain-containing protein [Clostridium sp. Marseille-Q2269]
MKRKFIKRFSVILLVLTFIFTLTACSSKEEVKVDKNAKEIDLKAYKNNDFLITAQQVHKLQGSKDLVILDCNKPDLYAKEHIDGAISVGLHSFSDKVGKPGDPDWGTIKKKEDLKKALESLGIDNKKTVVFYSNVFKGPGADGRAVWQLRMAGLKNVKLMVGGLTYWKKLGYEVNNKPVKPTPTSGVVLKDYDLTNSTNKEYVYNNLSKEVILDVRTEGEYKGSQKAGEPRGGHIKGAKNLVWTDILNKDGTPKSPEDIKKIMASVGVKPEDEFVVY